MIGQQGSLGVSPAELLAAKNMASGKSDMNKEISLGGDLTRLMLAAMQLKKSQAELEKAKLTRGANPQTTVAQDVQKGIAQLQGQAPQQAPQPQGQPQGQPQQMAQMDSGIGGLPAGAIDNEDAFAGGGIVAFAAGGIRESGDDKISPEVQAVRDEEMKQLKIAEYARSTPELQALMGKEMRNAGINTAGIANIAPTAAQPENIARQTADDIKQLEVELQRKMLHPDQRNALLAELNTKKKIFASLPNVAAQGNPDSIASRTLGLASGARNANAAEVPGAKAAAPTTDSNGVTVGDVGSAAGVAALGGSAIVERINNARKAAIAARNAALSVGPLPGGTPPMPKAPITAASVLGNMGSGISAGLQSKLAPVLPATKLGAAAALAAPIASAVDTYNTSTDDYYKRFGLEQPEGNGLLRNLKDLGVRGLGAASDLGNTLTFGLAEKYAGYRDKYNPDGSPILKNVATTKPAASKPVDAAPDVEKQSVDDVSQANRNIRADREPDDSKYAPKVDAYDEIRSLIKKLPPPESEEDAEERYQKTAEKFGVSAENIKKHFTDQADSLTNQANQARQDRNVNLWMSAAQGFFAMAGGMSPYAVKNFADGLGVGTKQMTQTLGEYNKEQREIDKANRELAKLNISSRMQMSKEYLDRREKARDKATTHQEKQINLLTSLSRIVMEDRRTDVLAGGRDADRLQKEQATKDRAVAELRKSEEYKDITRTIERLTNKKDRTPADTSNLAGLQLRKRQMMNAALGDSSSQSGSGGAGRRPDPSKIGQFDN